MSDSFYKYRSFNEFTNNIILNSSLYFSSPNDFNDPFDCQLSYKDKYTKREIRDFFIDLLKRNSHENYRLKDLLKIYGKPKEFIDFSKEIDTKIKSNRGNLKKENCLV